LFRAGRRKQLGLVLGRERLRLGDEGRLDFAVKSGRHTVNLPSGRFRPFECSLPLGTGGSFNERMAIAKQSRPREQRSDAARNHEALVRAATAVVHRAGPHVSMATIAADAGVGIGTLYRHFPTREDVTGMPA
jgi:hypothetical protein